jgi:hypothetical protein
MHYSRRYGLPITVQVLESSRTGDNSRTGDRVLLVEEIRHGAITSDNGSLCFLKRAFALFNIVT